MKPATVKSLLQQHGSIGRVFLTPEDPAVYARRKAHGGNKKRSFIDGWVEFVDKRQAKAAVELLNARIIGGKKGGYYHDDVWNLRYLKGFKWHHLTEQIKNENAERAGRLRAEIARSTRENKEFVANVERAKMLGGMEAKRKKKSAAEGGAGAAAGETKKRADDGGRPALLFRQNEVKSRKLPKESAVEQPEEVKRVLSKIF
ncbi:uncharacterized protein K452DRAFT_284823 [Aplosporella prunicola CBS 121167]|uniref:Uncharacterized protein n=1 Tax=Aplosporella prunicola CBS 121167 TaxID=1176127 RepID=A0A6A6BK60_9PEZI|nr:uncharacterized protein K452DRAFT_284823 [Aplosporella prunicola CBS 121167]KAF2144499.1 hypothetical protein K452DRAFT_284823 [Aplosporella prunicola CBS 121167]